jgi:hypothetical protein
MLARRVDATGIERTVVYVLIPNGRMALAVAPESRGKRIIPTLNSVMTSAVAADVVDVADRGSL